MNKTILKLLLVSILATTVVKAESSQNVDELISQAHQYDNMYTSGAQASQKKALSFYQSALESGADEKQRLHILFRMAQLNGSSYDVTKGEKPDLRKAIELNKQIVDLYPPDEPLVYKAMISIGDHYVSLWEFGEALVWFKKPLEYDISAMQQEVEALEEQMSLQRDSLTHHDPDDRSDRTMGREEQLELREQNRRAGGIRRTLDIIKHYQETALDQAGYAAKLIYPYIHDKILQDIANKYPETFIAERAEQLIAAYPHKMQELEILVPKFDEESFLSTSDVPVDFISSDKSGKKDVVAKGQSYSLDDAVEPNVSAEVNTDNKMNQDKYAMEQPRGPPGSSFTRYIIVAAGLIVLALAVVKIKRLVTVHSFCQINDGYFLLLQ